MSSDLLSFIQALPKTETHLHIEGALPLELFQRVRPEFAGRVPESWKSDFKFRDFAHFESELLDMAFSWFTSPERYHEAAKAVFARHLEQNVRYVETSFASGMVEFLGLDARATLQAIRAAVPPELEVRIFFGIHHRGRPPKMESVLADALTWRELDGIDLHGPEDHEIEPWTADYWAAARKAGKYTKAHAGEFMGADFVLDVISDLYPHRIQHGVRAVEDWFLMKELERLGIGLDVCPISNHKLMPGITLATHPIRALFDAGVKVTLSTDDPISFGNTLTDEYVALAEQRGFTRRELAQLARNGFELALLTETQKAPLLAELDAVIAGAS